MGSKSALDAFFVAAKLLSSCRTSRLKPGKRLLKNYWPSSTGSTLEPSGEPFFSLYITLSPVEAMIGAQVDGVMSDQCDRAR